jgi:excisionase family DNA binding protein
MKYKPLFEPNDYRRIVTFIELEELTGIRRTTLRKWLDDGKIPGAFRNGPGTRWQFRREALEEWWRKMHENYASE